MNTDTSLMTLEEIMQDFYRKPCTRVDEKWNTCFKRGSVLVYEDRVVVVANDDDNDLNVQRSPIPRLRFITPQRKFGVLPGSHFYTKECYVTVHAESDDVRVLRGSLRSRPVITGINTWGAGNKSGLLNVRCTEEAGLMAEYTATRLLIAFAEGAD